MQTRLTVTECSCERAFGAFIESKLNDLDQNDVEGIFFVWSAAWASAMAAAVALVELEPGPTQWQ
jgi:hypothetical protein